MSGTRLAPAEAQSPPPSRVWLAVGGTDFGRYVRSVLEGQREFGFVVAATATDADVAIADAESPMQEAPALLARLRGAPETARLPVLFLGGSRSARASLLGAGDARVSFLDAPFNANSLRAALRRLLDRST